MCLTWHWKHLTTPYLPLLTYISIGLYITEWDDWEPSKLFDWCATCIKALNPENCAAAVCDLTVLCQLCCEHNVHSGVNPMSGLASGLRCSSHWTLRSTARTLRGVKSMSSHQDLLRLRLPKIPYQFILQVILCGSNFKVIFLSDVKTQGHYSNTVKAEDGVWEASTFKFDHFYCAVSFCNEWLQIQTHFAQRNFILKAHTLITLITSPSSTDVKVLIDWFSIRPAKNSRGYKLCQVENNVGKLQVRW